MKTEFLKECGITDQEIIDKIMAQNGKDINNVRNELNTAKEQVTNLQEQLGERDKQLNELQDKVKGNEDLENQINALREQNTNAKNDYELKIANLVKENAIEIALREANAKNVMAVKPFLKMDNIKIDGDKVVGLSEQIDTLKAGENTAFLFGSVDPTPPDGLIPINPPNNQTLEPQGTENTFRSALSKRFKI